MQYIFQGFSTDGQYLIAFFYPVGSPQLPYSHDEIPPEELAQFETDWEAYMAAQTEKLDGLAESDWDPNLATLVWPGIPAMASPVLSTPRQPPRAL